jgi:hypothetical protein
MRSGKSWCSLLVGLALLLPGCQKLTYQKTFQLKPGGVETFMIDAPRSTQEVTATVTSSGVEVDGWIVLERDREAAETALRIEERPSGTLAEARGEDFTLSATIPAKSGFSLLISGAHKRCEVNLKVTGR